MKILIAPDKFKGSLSATQVCDALSSGIKKSNPDISIIKRPMADGGDGSLAILNHYLDLRPITLFVENPVRKYIQATYHIANQTAYIELAAASGISLLSLVERDALRTSTLGTGQLIADAIQRGCTEIKLFIGGSATNDGGMGIAEALGYQFLDKLGTPLLACGENLLMIDQIDQRQICFDPANVDFQVICDVNNPFYGPKGAAHIYARQKGANDQAIDLLDRGLEHLAKKLVEQGFPDVSALPGAGAAGGVGGGMVALCQATLISGIQLFSDLTNLEQVIQDCDIVITGEGKLDSQSEQGKVPGGVARLAQKYKKDIIAVCGVSEKGVAEALGIKKVYTLLEKADSIEESMKHASELLEQIGAKIPLEV